MSKNPYPNRPYPVGVLSYPTTKATASFVSSVKKYALLEYGEAELLIDIPNLLNMGGDYLNLGHGAGGSALLLAQGLVETDLHGVVHSVDTFKDRTWGRTESMEIVESFHLGSIVKLYKARTDQTVDLFNDLTFVFIDADHSYEGVLHDFVNYAPKVIKGGAVAFHDTNQEPSNRVIREQVLSDSSWQLMIHVNRIQVFQRV